MKNHDDSTFLAIMAVCIIIACATVLCCMSPDDIEPPLTMEQKIEVMNR